MKLISFTSIALLALSCSEAQSPQLRGLNERSAADSTDVSSSDAAIANDTAQGNESDNKSIQTFPQQLSKEFEDPFIVEVEEEQKKELPEYETIPTNPTTPKTSGNPPSRPSSKPPPPPTEPTVFFSDNISTTTVAYLTYGNFDEPTQMPGATAWETSMPFEIPSSCERFLDRGPFVQYIMNNRDSFKYTDEFVGCLEQSGINVTPDYAAINKSVQPHSVTLFVTQFAGEFKNQAEGAFIRSCKFEDADGKPGGRYSSFDPNCMAKKLPDGDRRTCLTFGNSCDSKIGKLKAVKPNNRPAFKASVAATRASAGILKSKKRCIASLLPSIDARTFSTMIFGGAPFNTKDECLRNIRAVNSVFKNPDSRKLYIHLGFDKIGEIVGGKIK